MKKTSIIFVFIFVIFIDFNSFNCVHAKNNLSGVYRASLNPNFVEYIKNKHKDGFIPSPLIINKSNIGYKSRFSEAYLPSQYDLRNLSKLTPIKNQSDSSACWTFAVYGSLESTLMPEELYDFSENNLKNKNGFDWTYGGNYDMATAYLARWSGPVLEQDDVFNEYNNYSPNNLNVQKHVQDVLYIPGRTNALNNNDIKIAIKNYGAVASALHWDNYYYDEGNNTYYFDGIEFADHAIDIVGWDDNFSKDKFKNKPLGNGAFICRNSWGSSWGDGGYFYVSYYDTAFAKDMGAVFLNGEPTDNYNNIYQYDTLGAIDYIGYNSSAAWFCNVFQAENNEILEAVSFYTSSRNTQYKVYINKDFKDINSLSVSNLMQVKSGSIDMPGYHTIKLDPKLYDLTLDGDKKFAVVVQVVGSNTMYPIPAESPYEGYSSRATADAGQSYISFDGNEWSDLNYNQLSSYKNTNVCLKAFTNNLENQSSILNGDVNGDGTISVDDCDLLKRYLIGIYNISNVEKLDEDGDGKITSTDYSIIKKFINKNK